MIEALKYLITSNMGVYHLIYQHFLNGRQRLRKGDVKESQTIGSIRIY